MRIFQIDAFTAEVFKGNPAAVCLLSHPTDDNWMQNIATEMNLSETAFLVQREAHYDLRWFTPTTEVDLCGHATLASAHVLFETGELAPEDQAVFHSRSGLLTATKDGNYIVLDFPASHDRPVSLSDDLRDTMGVAPLYTGTDGSDLLVELGSDQQVISFMPDLKRISELSYRGIIITARSPAPQFDFVSRFFAPAVGVSEDPVTGSAHCYLGPYWAAKLNKNVLTGYQASRRGGTVRVTVSGDRILLGGTAVTVMTGQLHTEPPGNH